METAISITDRAAKKITDALAAVNRGNEGIRIAVIGAGPLGLRYKLNTDLERAHDLVFEKAGAKVLVDPKSALYLNGSELDYHEGLMESCLVIRNPRPEHGCSCSTSLPFYPEDPSTPSIW